MVVARKRRRSNSSRRKPLWQIRLLYYPLLVLIRTITSVICTVRAHGAEEVNGDRRGCIMLANHQSNIDPFVINFALKRQIQYLVSDSNMRSAPARGFFWMVGAIPKTKSMRDINAIRKSLDTVRAGGIVGVFPEGVCSWDGDTVNIIESTAKLIKLLRAPVYVARVHGTYFILPRWSRGARRGEADIAYRLLFTPQQIAALTVDEIHDATRRAVHASAQELQRADARRYRGNRRAEWCERFLFLCPLCAEVGTLVSDGDAIRCAACGPLATLDEYYALRWVAEITPQSPATTPFAHLAQWNAWQREYWKERLKRAAKRIGRSNRNGEAGTDLHAAAAPNAVGNTADPHATANSPLLPSERAIVKTGYRQQPLTTLGMFDMWLSADGILHYRSAARRRMDAPAPSPQPVNVTAIEGCNVQNKEILEYYHDGTLYHVKIDTQRRNAYKWMLTIQYLTEQAQSQLPSVATEQ